MWQPTSHGSFSLMIPGAEFGGSEIATLTPVDGTWRLACAALHLDKEVTALSNDAPTGEATREVLAKLAALGRTSDANEIAERQIEALARANAPA